MKIPLKMVIIINKEGEYVVHGSSDQNPLEMYKQVMPLWDLNPFTDSIQYIEIEVDIPS